MRRRLRDSLLSVLLISSLVLVGCSSDPKATQIPSDATKLDSIKPSIDKLTDSDKRELLGYLFRTKMSAAFGRPAPVEMITIGEAITKQEQFEKEQKAKADEEAALKSKLETDQEDLIKQMNSTLVSTLVSKENTPRSEDEFSNHIITRIGFKNKGSKTIIAFKGTLLFNDVFDAEISHSEFQSSETMKPGYEMIFKDTFDDNGFDQGLNKLHQTTAEKIHFVFRPSAIAFSDGTKLVLPSQ